MTYNFTVAIPAKEGKITKKKIKDVTYIYYEYSRTYNPEKKYAIPNRSCIGKLHDNNLMTPNDNFFKYFPEIEVEETKNKSSRSSCLKAGSHIVINKIIKDYKLDDFLTSFSNKDKGLLLDLAAYSINSENNAGQYYPHYAYSYPLFTNGMKQYSDSKISSFLAEITDDDSVTFLNNWNINRNHEDKIYLSYDSTNKNSQAGDVEFIEYGKSKAPMGSKIFNYSIAYDTENKEPLFYESYPGSIIDVSQLEYMLDKANSYGYKSISFILDRGYFSQSNIMYMDELNYSFIIMLKGKKELVSQMILDKKHSFEINRDCYIREYKSYGTTIESKLFITDNKARYFHLYYSSTREAAEREILETKLELMHKIILKGLGRKNTFDKNTSKYFDFEYVDGVLVSYKENKEIIEKELMLCGYFVIVTSDNMSAATALKIYKSRDVSEKLFRGDKTYLANKSLRVYSTESTEAKIFIEFIALIIRNKMYSLLKTKSLEIDSKQNYMTVPAAIRELNKIEMIRGLDNIYRLDHAITATQKVILSAFDLTADDVVNEIKNISDKLKKSVF